MDENQQTLTSTELEVSNFAEFKQAVLEAEAYIQGLQAFVSCCPQKNIKKMIEKRIQRNKLKVIAKYSHNGRGIVTGPHNPASVGCNMYVLEGGLSGTTFILKRWHEGHNMLAHGGIIASILDEVLGYSNHTREYVLGLKYTPVFTGTVKYTYLKPVKVGERYFASAKITKIEGRKRFVEGEIYDDDGLIYATGEGVFLTSDELSDDEEIVKYTELTKDDPVEI